MRRISGATIVAGVVLAACVGAAPTPASAQFGSGGRGAFDSGREAFERGYRAGRGRQPYNPNYGPGAGADWGPGLNLVSPGGGIHDRGEGAGRGVAPGDRGVLYGRGPYDRGVLYDGGVSDRGVMYGAPGGGDGGPLD